jgi:hypothetical protein
MHLAVLIVATPEGSGAGFSLQVAAPAEVDWGKAFIFHFKPFC